MLHTPPAKLINRKHFMQRRTVQLGGALVLAFALPWVMRLSVMTNPPGNLLIVSAMANFLAVLLGYYIFRSLTLYPGIRAGLYILPTFAASYGIVLIGILALRYDYSRFVLLAGFVLCCLWFVAVFFMTRRNRSVTIGIVPIGDIGDLSRLRGANWLALQEPAMSLTRICDGIVADFRADLPDEWDRFLADAALAGLPVYHVKQLRESLSGKVEIEHLSENNFGSLIPNSAYMNLKRVVDFLLALVAAAVVLVPLAICCVLIKLDSRGPALFRQRRMGKAGKTFLIYKLRTMRLADDTPQCARQGAMTADADPRVTRIGRVLRRTRIDELPQIFNILRGEMSWIGPRPEAEVLSSWYEAELPFYRYRHIVPPGITGWAQVNQGHVADVESVLGKLQYDFYYIKHFSPWLDVLITIMTLRIVITGFGSR